MDEKYIRNASQKCDNRNDEVEQKRSLVPLRPTRFHSVGSLPEKISEEELHDFLQISSDIDISLDLETVGDYLCKLEEKENRLRDNRLSRNRNVQPLLTDSFASADDQADPVSGCSFCTATSSEEDTALVSREVNTSLNNTPECDSCGEDHLAEKVSLDIYSFSKSDNTSCNSNVPNYVTESNMVPDKRTMYSLPSEVQKVSSVKQVSREESGVLRITNVSSSVEDISSGKKSCMEEDISCDTNFPNPVEEISPNNKSSLKEIVSCKVSVPNPVEGVLLDKKSFTKREDAPCSINVPNPVEASSNKKSFTKKNALCDINVPTPVDEVSSDKKTFTMDDDMSCRTSLPDTDEETTLDEMSWMSSKKENMPYNTNVPTPVEEDAMKKTDSTKQIDVLCNTIVHNPVEKVLSYSKSFMKENVSDNQNDPIPVAEVSHRKRQVDQASYTTSNLRPIEQVSLDKKFFTNKYVLSSTNIPTPIEKAPSNKKTFEQENAPCNSHISIPVKKMALDKNILTKVDYVSCNTNVPRPVEEVPLDKNIFEEKNVPCNNNIPTPVKKVTLDKEIFTKKNDVSCNTNIHNKAEEIPSDQTNFTKEDSVLGNTKNPGPMEEVSLDKKISTNKDGMSYNTSLPDASVEVSLNVDSSIKENMSCNINAATVVEEVSSDKKTFTKKDDVSCNTDAVGEVSLNVDSSIKENELCNTNPAMYEMSSDKTNITKDDKGVCITDDSSPIEEVLSDKISTKKDGLSCTTHHPSEVEEMTLDENSSVKENVSCSTNVLTRVQEVSTGKKNFTTKYVSCNTDAPGAVEEMPPDDKSTIKENESCNISVSRPVKEMSSNKTNVTKEDDVLLNTVVEMSSHKISTKKDVSCNTEAPGTDGEMPLDEKICIKKNASCDSSIPTLVQKAASLDKKITTNKDDVLHNTGAPNLNAFTNSAGNTVTENSEIQYCVVSVADSMDKINRDVSSTPPNATPVTCLYRNLKKPMSLTEICKRKEKNQVFSNSDTAVGKLGKDRKLLNSYLKSKAVNGLQDSSDGKFSEETSEVMPCVATMGSVDVGTSSHICGKGDGDFVVVDGDSALQENEIANDVVEIIECKENSTKQVCYLSEEEQEHKVKECIDKNSDNAFKIPVDTTPNVKVPVELNPLVQYALKQIVKPPNHSSDAVANMVNLPSVEYFVMPGDFLNDSVETDWLDAFETQEMKSPEISDSQNPIDYSNYSTIESIPRPSCSFEQDTLEMHTKSRSFRGYTNNQSRKEKETLDTKTLLKHVVDTSDVSSLTTHPKLGYPFVEGMVPIETNELLNSLDHEVEEILSQAAKSFKYGQEKDKIIITSSQSRIGSCLNIEANNFSSSVSVLSVGMPSIVNNQQVEKEPSEITEMLNDASGSASDTFNTASIGSSNEPRGSQEEGTSAARDTIATQLNEAFRSFEQQNEMRTSKEPPEQTTDSVEDMFNSSSQASFSASDFSFQLDDSFQDASNMCDSIDSLVESLLHSSDQQPNSAKQNDSPSVRNNSTATNMQGSSFEDILSEAHDEPKYITEDILPRKYGKRNDRAILLRAYDKPNDKNTVFRPYSKPNDGKEESLLGAYGKTNDQYTLRRKYGKPKYKDENITPGVYIKSNSRDVDSLSRSYGKPNVKVNSSGTYGKPKNIDGKPRSPGFENNQIEAIQNYSYLSITTADVQQISLPSSPYQLCENENQDWGLEIDRDVQRYASLLQNKSTPHSYRNSIFKKTIQPFNLDTAESDLDLKLNAFGERQGFARNTVVEGTSPKTDCMSLQEFFDSTKQLAFNESSWDFFDPASDEDVRNTSSGEFRHLERSTLDKSDFEIFERDSKYQQLPFHSFREKSAIPKSNRFSGHIQQMDPKRKEQGVLKRNAQGVLCKNTKIQRRN